MSHINVHAYNNLLPVTSADYNYLQLIKVIDVDIYINTSEQINMKEIISSEISKISDEILSFGINDVYIDVANAFRAKSSSLKMYAYINEKYATFYKLKLL